MFKHMFINANIMILLKIFQNHADFDLGALIFAFSSGQTAPFKHITKINF
jgi:hypothetical protein